MVMGKKGMAHNAVAHAVLWIRRIAAFTCVFFLHVVVLEPTHTRTFIVFRCFMVCSR